MGKTLTVSQLNSYIKGVFDDELILQGIIVTGEIFEFRTAGGNSYITLTEGECILNCVYFSSAVEYRVGSRVALSGTVRFYPKSGKVSFIVSHLKVIGRGELLLALAETRERLRKDGVFDNSRALPALITRVALVTSEDGAVMHDFFSIVDKLSYLSVRLFPVRVQGKGAAEEIIRIMSGIGKDIFDVIVIARGGGSASDLSEFNNELLSRAIYASKMPVISAVGHETDYTLSDFAADIRAGTPSIAAEMIARNNACFFERLTVNLNFIAAKTERLFDRRSEQISNVINRIERQISARSQNALGRIVFHTSKNQGLLEALLGRCGYRLRAATASVAGGAAAKLVDARGQLEVARVRAEELNPAKILKKGYAKISKNYTEISGVAELCVGDEVRIIMSDGSVFAKVSDVCRKLD